MNSAIASLAGLAESFQHLLGSVLLPLAAGLPLVVLAGLLATTRRRRTPAATPADPTPPAARPAEPPSIDAVPAVPPAEAAAATRTALAAMQAAAPPRTAPPAEAPPLRGAPAPLGPVLLVDDSAVVRAKLLRLFQGAGFDAVAVRDGVEALDALARMPFAVLVTDLEMPNMDGFELIAAVQGSLDTEDLPIVAITGHEALQARVHEFGGLYGIFRKPWNDRELLRRVQSLAALRRRTRAATP
jgi:CheY-like chemotaxis protein